LKGSLSLVVLLLLFEVKTKILEKRKRGKIRHLLTDY
jgi:hypothetical protein